MDNSEPIVPNAPPKGSNVKWYAIIVVLIVIIAAFGVLAFYHPVTTGSSSSVTSAAAVATIGQPYNLTIKTNGAFDTITVYFGDGTTTIVPYSGSDTVTVSHVYNTAGVYNIYYTVNFGGNVYSNVHSIVSVQAAGFALPSEESLGSLALSPTSTPPEIPNTQLYNASTTGKPTNLSFIVGYFTPPTNPNYEVIAQNIIVYKNGTTFEKYRLPYYYNVTDQAYKLPPTDAYFNLTNLSQGYYEIAVNTVTGSLGTVSLSTSIMNTTVIHYAAGSVGIYNATGKLFNGTATLNTLIGLLYPINTTVLNYNGTFLNYLAPTVANYTDGANMNYSKGVTVNYMNGQAITLYKGAGFSVNVNTTFNDSKDFNATVASGSTLMFKKDVFNGIYNTTSMNFMQNAPLTFNKSVNTSMAAMTNITLASGSKVIFMQNTNISVNGGTATNYTKGSSYTAPSSEIITFLNKSIVEFPATGVTAMKGFTYSFLTNSTLEFGSNTTVMITSPSNIMFNSTENVSSLASSGFTFLNKAMITFDDNTSVSYTSSASIVNYSKDFTVSYPATKGVGFNNSATVKYEANTSLYYTNPETKVLYPMETNVTATFQVNGMTSSPIVTGELNASASEYQSTYYYDVVVFPNAALYVVPTTVETFINAEAETGAYKTLDGAIAYDTVSGEILENTYQFLVGYNGTSSTSFIPELATNLPNITNGEINDNYANYTVHDPWGTSYEVHIKPYENYTFYIRSNATWQNGQPVTAWDVEYSMARTLLFDSGTPGTPGWIEAQYLLPGNYFVTNTFWNITQNMTVNNKTNSITFHFQVPMSPTLVNEILSASGDFVMDASWIAAHATSSQPALQWDPAGFAAYEAQGSESDYNPYFVNHIMADGPYEIDYIVPSSEVVLIANPYFHPPSQYYPAPKIKEVVIEYIGETSTRYLQMKSGYAQAGGIPSSDFDLVQSLNATHMDYYTFFPTLSIYWYNFNANINTTILNTEYKGANVPQTLFTVLQIRQAFAYAYNESEYLGEDIGNSIYNVTFASSYVGMLPLGMDGYQSEAVINESTHGAVPYFDLGKAAALFSEGVKVYNKEASKSGSMTITTTPSGTYTYNGLPLQIPIFIYSADPSDLAGAEQWGSYLSKYVVIGASFPVEPTAFPVLLGNQVQGQNPMPIYELGWAPDYPYPTDYLNPMANPINSSTYPGPNDFTPYWFSNNSSNPTPNASEAYNLSLMHTWYVKGTSASNPDVAMMYFHMMNDMLVNMTFYVYLFQSYVFTTMSYKVPPSVVKNDEGNLMWAAGAGDFLYNYLYYT